MVSCYGESDGFEDFVLRSPVETEFGLFDYDEDVTGGDAAIESLVVGLTEDTDGDGVL